MPMHNLTDAQQDRIKFLQKKVDKYQVIPELCSELKPGQCTVLAELQVIYDNLSPHTLKNHAAIFNPACKGVTDKMKQFETTYANTPPDQLYCVYLKKYKEAKSNPDEQARLDKLDLILSDDCTDVQNAIVVVPES